MYHSTKIKFSPMSSFLKAPIILFLPYTPEEAPRHHFPNHCTPRPAKGLPTIKQINNTSRRNPRHPKMTKIYILFLEIESCLLQSISCLSWSWPFKAVFLKYIACYSHYCTGLIATNIQHFLVLLLSDSFMNVVNCIVIFSSLTRS